MTHAHDPDESRSTTAGSGSMHIGDVAERTGLSLRTIRYYEEAGLVAPVGRTTGGFRLYAENDIERLELIKQMKPLGFSLEEMRELLRLLDELAAETGDPPSDATLEGIRRFAQDAETRCAQLREQLAIAIRFAELLRQRSAEPRRTARSR